MASWAQVPRPSSLQEGPSPSTGAWQQRQHQPPTSEGPLAQVREHGTGRRSGCPHGLGGRRRPAETTVLPEALTVGTPRKPPSLRVRAKGHEDRLRRRRRRRDMPLPTRERHEMVPALQGIGQRAAMVSCHPEGPKREGPLIELVLAVEGPAHGIHDGPLLETTNVRLGAMPVECPLGSNGSAPAEAGPRG